MVLLERDRYFHIYNRGNNRENIFKSDENRRYFLNLYERHLGSSVSTFAYCLLNNHFHVAIRVEKENKEITQSISNFFNAYAKAFNKAHNRTGSLFSKNFRRIQLDKESYLKNLILYIHLNPQLHFGLDFKTYQFSSYSGIVNGNNLIIKIPEVLEIFGGLDNFRSVHENRNAILEEKYKLE